MKTLAILLLVVIILLLLAGPAMAMVSTQYHLDWFTPLTGSGGSASSAHYNVYFTTGQAAQGDVQQSTNHKTGLGFWYARLVELRILVPAVYH
jgi:hypothetical protein